MPLTLLLLLFFIAIAVFLKGLSEKKNLVQRKKKKNMLEKKLENDAAVQFVTPPSYVSLKSTKQPYNS